jgi:hypothetical protein
MKGSCCEVFLYREKKKWFDSLNFSQNRKNGWEPAATALRNHTSIYQVLKWYKGINRMNNPELDWYITFCDIQAQYNNETISTFIEATIIFFFLISVEATIICFISN